MSKEFLEEYKLLLKVNGQTSLSSAGPDQTGKQCKTRAVLKEQSDLGQGLKKQSDLGHSPYGEV